MSAQPSYPTAHPLRRTVLACTALGLMAACQTPLDFDMRGNFGNAPSTANAVQNITADRPRPDNRGVISYPGYQVAIAQRGDTIVEVANRVGADPQALARFNGLELGDKLRGGLTGGCVLHPKITLGETSQRRDIAAVMQAYMGRANGLALILGAMLRQPAFGGGGGFET